jgi:hypothetical protein
MSPNLIFWGVFLLAFVLLILLPHTYQKRRIKKFEHFAQQRGFSFTADGSDLVPRDLDKFYASGNRAVSQRWYRNVIYGELHGARFFAFEYRYRIKQTWNRRTAISKPQTLILFVNPSINFSHFALLPKHAFVLDHPVFGNKFLEIKDDKPFSSLYLLQGESENAVRSLFDERVRAHFVKLVNKSCEGKGEQFLYYYDGHWFDPSKLDAFIKDAFAAYELFHSKKYAGTTG